MSCRKAYDDQFMGMFFLLTEVAALGTNIFSYLMVESLRAPSGHFSGKDVDTARAFQQVQYISLAVFGLLYLWGVIDSLVEYEAKSVRVRTVDELPRDYIIPEKPSGTFEFIIGGLRFTL